MPEDKEPAPFPNSDEELPEQLEVSSTTIESGELVVSGPNANINVNKASYQDFLEIYERAFKQGCDTATEQFYRRDWKKDLEENLFSKKEQKDAEDTEAAATPGGDTEQLETLDDVADWYENLPDMYAQYLVQTMAALNGAQAVDIARLTKTLCAPITSERQGHLRSEVPESPASAGLSLDKSGRSLSDRERYQHAHIQKSRINGISRLFWKDLDSSGQQRFAMLVLRYLAEETLFSSGPDLTDILKGWAENEPSDCAWRAARALGVILFWRSSTQELWRLANEWANRTRIRKCLVSSGSAFRLGAWNQG